MDFGNFTGFIFETLIFEWERRTAGFAGDNDGEFETITTVLTACQTI